MLYTLLACCFVSHLNYTPTADSCTEPAAVIFGLPHYVLVRQPLFWEKGHEKNDLQKQVVFDMVTRTGIEPMLPP